MISDMDTVVHMGYAVQIPLMKDLLLFAMNKWPVAFCPSVVEAWFKVTLLSRSCPHAMTFRNYKDVALSSSKGLWISGSVF